jgi:hypothetical protein
VRRLDDVLPQLLEIFEPAEHRSPDSCIAHSELTVEHAGLGSKNRIELFLIDRPDGRRRYFSDPIDFASVRNHVADRLI